MRKNFFISIFLLGLSLSFSQKNLLMPFHDTLTKKWGYVDATKRWVIPPAYFSAKQFYRSAAIVVGDSNTYGLIDTNGKKLTEFIYSLILEFENDITVAHKGGKSGWINYQGKELTPIVYDAIGRPDKDPVYVSIRGFNGFVNSGGKLIILPRYRCLLELYGESGSFDEGLAFICNEKKYALFDSSGKQLTQFILEPSQRFWDLSFAGGVCPVRINKKEVFIDRSGKIVQYDTLVFVEKRKEKDSLIRMTYLFQYDDSLSPRPDLLQGKYTNVKNSKIVFKRFVFPDGKPAFDNSIGFGYLEGYREGLMRVWKNRKIGFVDLKGQLVIPAKYERVLAFKNGLAEVWKPIRKGGFTLIGYIDKNGKEYFWENL
jgi:hypothetical protein